MTLLNLQIKRLGRDIGPSGLMAFSTSSTNLTYRLSHRRRMLRVGFVENKIVEFAKTKRLLMVEDITAFREEITKAHAVTFKRGKIRVHGIAAFIVPILKLGKLNWFISAFNRWFKLVSVLGRIERCSRLLKRLLGSEVMDNGKVVFTKKFWILLASFVFYGKFPYKLSIGRNFYLVNLTWRYNKLRKFVVAGHPVLDILWSLLKEIRGWSRGFMYEKEVLGTIENPDTLEPQDASPIDEFIEKIPIPNMHVFGEKPLTRAQLARVMHRKVDAMFMTIWDLLFHTPVIRKEFRISNWFVIIVDLSLDSINIYTAFPKRNEKGFVVIEPNDEAFAAKPLFEYWNKQATFHSVLYPMDDNWTMSNFVRGMYAKKMQKIERQMRSLPRLAGYLA